jgi:hypothetical protein
MFTPRFPALKDRAKFKGRYAAKNKKYAALAVPAAVLPDK